MSVTSQIPIKILIVEDFHAETEMLLRELESAELSFSSKVVHSEEEFKQQIQSFGPHIILSPYSLASTNAVKLLSIAKAHGVAAPFILLAYDLSEDIAIDLLGEGIEDYILRSTKKRLPVAIRKALQRYKIQQELLLSQAKLQASEASLQEAQKIAKVGSWEWEINQEFLNCSDEMFRIYGIGKKEFSLADAKEHVHPKDKDRITMLMAAGLPNGYLPVVEYSIITGDGTVKDVRAHAEGIKDAEGNVIKMIGTFQDITERKQIELELARSKNLLSLGEEISNSGSFELDFVNKKTIWSSNFYRIVGIEPDTVITSKLFVSCVHPEDRQKYKDALASNIRSGIGTPFVYRIVRPDNGQTVHLQANGKRVEGEDGNTRWIGSVLDISDRVQQQLDLQRSESSLNLAQSIAKIGSWTLDPETQALWWSAEMFRIHEIEEQELSVKLVQDLTHPDDLDLFETGFNDVMSGKTTNFVYRIISPKTGQTKYVQGVGKIILNQKGDVENITGTLQDVTEAKLFEQELLEKEQVLREMAENIDRVFWLTDKTGAQLLYMSPLYEEIYGRPIEEIYENSDAWSENIHPEDRERVYKAFREKGHLGEYDEEYRLVHADGTLKWVRARAFPIKDDDGDVVRLAGITEEITKRKNDQELIETLSLVASETSNGVLIQNAKGQITWANRGFTEITGYSFEEALGKEPWSFLSGANTDQALLATTYERMAAGTTFTSENVMVDKNGEEVWVSTAFNPIMDEHGKLKQIVSIGIDVTRQKEKEFSQNEMLDELKKVNNELRNGASN